MDEVLRNLVDKDRVEAEDCQRVLIASYNGLAGLALLTGGAAAAVAWYSKVLKLERENVGVCEVDNMQLIHVYANLGVYSLQTLSCHLIQLSMPLISAVCLLNVNVDSTVMLTAF